MCVPFSNAISIFKVGHLISLTGLRLETLAIMELEKDYPVSLPAICYDLLRRNNHQQAVIDQAHTHDDDYDDDFRDHTAGRPKLEKSLLRKQDWRLLPLCSVVYLLCFLDRSNIGILCIFLVAALHPQYTQRIR